MVQICVCDGMEIPCSHLPLRKSTTGNIADQQPPASAPLYTLLWSPGCSKSMTRPSKFVKFKPFLPSAHFTYRGVLAQGIPFSMDTNFWIVVSGSSYAVLTSPFIDFIPASQPKGSLLTPSLFILQRPIC